jgi:hypothetical protein
MYGDNEDVTDVSHVVPFQVYILPKNVDVNAAYLRRTEIFSLL